MVTAQRPRYVVRVLTTHTLLKPVWIDESPSILFVKALVFVACLFLSAIVALWHIARFHKNHMNLMLFEKSIS